MDDRIIHEKEYLLKIIEKKLPNENPYVLQISDDKEILYVGIGNTEDNILFEKMDLMCRFRDLYYTATDLRNKIYISLCISIDLTNSQNTQNNYSYYHADDGEEWLNYYYIENALYRASTLWDLLAHFCNLKYRLELKQRYVSQRKVFSSNEKEKIQLWGKDTPSEIDEIMEYMHEKDDINTDYENTDSEWRENYAFIKKLRDSLVHNHSINRGVYSGYQTEHKHPPEYILKRLCEDYSKVEMFLAKINDDILRGINS